jgi:glutamine cyclotransferase
MFRNIFLPLILLFSSYLIFNHFSAQNNKNTFTKLKRNELYYTQGLFFDSENSIIESGGMWGESVLVRIEYPSMKILHKVNLENEYFAEGVARCGEFVYQLTWKNRIIFKYSYPELNLVSKIPLDSNIKEGWGLASFKDKLYATDGSEKIYIIDCEDLKVVREISVTFREKPLKYINDLDIVDGIAYVNVYYDKNIYKIDLHTGNVIKVYGMDHLIKSELEGRTLTEERWYQGEVLNGITFNPMKKNFLVTGKKWGYYYEVYLD